MITPPGRGLNQDSTYHKWPNPRLLRMKEGCAIKGCVLFNGQPLQGVKLGMSTTVRHSGEHLSGFEAMTDAQGQFLFNNVPPGTEFTVFSIMDSFKSAGVAVWQKIASPGDTEPLELGKMEAKKAHRITGRVVLADGKHVPFGTRIRLSREEAWDSVVVQTDETGNFEVFGVPEEKVTIGLSVSGYRFSEKNPNLDSNRRELIGRVAEDISNLTILLEPGKTPGYDEIDHPSYEEEQKRSERVLKGVQ